MGYERRSRLAFGLIVTLIGVWFLVSRLMPRTRNWLNNASPHSWLDSWPLILVGVGLLLLAFGLLASASRIAATACLLVGVGGLLYWHNISGNPGSWAYTWALIPGFVGSGFVLSGLLGGGARHVRGGAQAISVSFVLFVLSGTLLGQMSVFKRGWPLLVIALGLLILNPPLFRRRRQPQRGNEGDGTG